MNTSITRREWFSRASAPAESLLPIFDVRDFGAVGDGATLNTKSIQAAIDAAHAAKGGVVLLPVGVFLCGTIELKSNVTFRLVAQGKLLGSPNPDDYQAGNNIPPGNGNVVFISAADAENVTIDGGGTIDGNGLAFFTGRGDGSGPGGSSAQAYTRRPHLLIFARCKNLRMTDVFLTASAYHCVRTLNCEYVYYERIRIHNRVNTNNDGFHFNGSRYVHINACDVKCQDDACALFGSNKFVTVANCSFSTRWSIFRFNTGECQNITVTNCLIYETYGCVIKFNCRAGSRVENLIFSNLIFRDVTGPITVGLNSPNRRLNPGEAYPQGIARGTVRNITFSNIRGNVVAEGRQFDDMHWPQGYRPGETRTCITLNGVAEDFLENIVLKNIHLTFEGGGTAEEAQLRDLPLIAGEYFEIGDRPAHGVYARNVRGLTLDNVRIETSKPDLRPAVILDNVSDANLSRVTAQGNPDGSSVIRCINTTNTLIASPRLLTPAAVYLAVEGERSADITLDGGDIRKAGKPATFDRGASEKAARLRT